MTEMDYAATHQATVWVADGKPTPTTDYGTRLAQGLTSLGYEVERRDLTHVTGDEPLSAGLHVLTGGATSVNDRTGWMDAGLTLVSRMIRAAEEGVMHLFGVCLGSQMIAECTSPGCIVSGESMQVGVTDVNWAAPELETPNPLPTALPSFHYEQIDHAHLLGQSDPATGVQILAQNKHVPVLAFNVGRNVLATQLHPEFSGNDLDDLMSYNRETITRHNGHPMTAHSHDALAPERALDALLSWSHLHALRLPPVPRDPSAKEEGSYG